MTTDSSRRPGDARSIGARDWADHVAEVPAEWFLRPEGVRGIHGIGHTRRVGVHVLRLSAALDLPAADTRCALAAARWHDLGRTHDGVEPEHGARSVRRVRKLGLADELVRAGELSPADVELVLFAVHYHSLDDAAATAAARPQPGEAQPPGAASLATQPPPRAALDLLWLLKDADALDRVRLGGGDGVDPRYLRHPCAVDLVGFAWELYTVLPG